MRILRAISWGVGGFQPHVRNITRHTLCTLWNGPRKGDAAEVAGSWRLQIPQSLPVLVLACEIVIGPRDEDTN